MSYCIRPASKTIFQFLTLVLLTKSAWSQSIWSVDYPDSFNNGYFFIAKPGSSDIFFTLGYDQLRFDPNQSHELSLMHVVPDGLFAKENLGTFSAPNRHMDVHFQSETHGVMVHENQILKTTNGGKSWHEVLVLSPNTQYRSSGYFTSVDFPTTQVGYAVGTGDKVFKTTDGGDSWIQLKWSSSTAPYRRLSNVKFINEHEGYALGYEVDDILLNIGTYAPLIYKTNDGGITWSEQFLEESDHHYIDIHFTEGETTYLSLVNRNYIVPNDKVLKSTDGGLNWVELPLPGASASTSLIIRSMHWFSSTEGIILGSEDLIGQHNHIYKSLDGGQTWNKTELPQGIAPFFGKISNLVMTFNGNNGLIAGASGNVLHSTDRGGSWSTLNEGLPDIQDISSVQGVTYAVGAGDLLLKKENGEWSRMETPTNPFDYEKAYVKVANSGNDRVAIIDVYGFLYTSTDGGSGWASYFATNSTTPFDIFYTDEGLMAVSRHGDRRLVFMILDEDTNTWRESFITDDVTISAKVSLQQIDDQNLFVKVNNELYMSNDGGDHWSTFNDLPQNAIPSTFFISPSGHAIVQTDNGELFVSPDSGTSWNQSALPTSSVPHLDLSISSLRGFGGLSNDKLFILFHASGGEDLRYKTLLFTSVDKGLNWQLEEMPFHKEPLDFGVKSYAVSQEKLFIGSSNGTILNYGRGIVTEIPDEITADPSISVYPNPFSSQLSFSDFVHHLEYRLFNIQGQKVQHGVVDSSERTVSISSELPPGIYLLRITYQGKVYSSKLFKR